MWGMPPFFFKKLGKGGMMILRVASVQMRLTFCKSKDGYLNKIEPFVKKACQDGARLVAFPEDTGTLLLGLYSHPLRIIRENLRSGETIKNLLIRLVRLPLVAKTFALVGPYAKGVYEETFSQLAKKYNIYILGGTILLPEGTKVYNISYLFNPQGEIIGTQKKTHLYLSEIAWGISVGDELQVFDTSIGKLGIAICMDNGYPEVARIMRLKGADVIIDPSANPDYYHHFASLNGLWARCQENYLFGIHSCMVGDVFGRLILRGKAKIMAPCYITPNIDGFIALAKEDNEEEVIVGDLDFDRLGELRREFDIVEIINTPLLKKYFPLYERISRRVRRPTLWSMLWGMTVKGRGNMSQ